MWVLVTLFTERKSLNVIHSTATKAEFTGANADMRSVLDKSMTTGAKAAVTEAWLHRAVNLIEDGRAAGVVPQTSSSKTPESNRGGKILANISLA